MVEERLVQQGRPPEEISGILNRIFKDYEIAFGGVRVGDLKEDGTMVVWKDVLECFKEEKKSGVRFGELDNVSDRGFLMLIVQDSDQLPADLKTRAIILFDEFSQF